MDAAVAHAVGIEFEADFRDRRRIVARMKAPRCLAEAVRHQAKQGFPPVASAKQNLIARSTSTSALSSASFVLPQDCTIHGIRRVAWINAYRLVVVGESTLEEARSIPYFATDIVGFARPWV